MDQTLCNHHSACLSSKHDRTPAILFLCGCSSVLSSIKATSLGSLVQLGSPTHMSFQLSLQYLITCLIPILCMSKPNEDITFNKTIQTVSLACVSLPPNRSFASPFPLLTDFHLLIMTKNLTPSFPARAIHYQTFSNQIYKPYVGTFNSSRVGNEIYLCSGCSKKYASVEVIIYQVCYFHYIYFPSNEGIPESLTRLLIFQTLWIFKEKSLSFRATQTCKVG